MIKPNRSNYIEMTEAVTAGGVMGIMTWAITVNLACEIHIPGLPYGCSNDGIGWLSATTLVFMCIWVVSLAIVRILTLALFFQDETPYED